MTETKPKLRLTGVDGNAFSVLAAARRVATKAEWNHDQIETFMDEATSGDYDHLLQTCMKFFDVE